MRRAAGAQQTAYTNKATRCRILQAVQNRQRRVDGRLDGGVRAIVRSESLNRHGRHVRVRCAASEVPAAAGKGGRDNAVHISTRGGCRIRLGIQGQESKDFSVEQHAVIVGCIGYRQVGTVRPIGGSVEAESR
ncbi:hypothetical protein REC12_14870 [Desulfosporosinus sp. PR]|uniref:hypothetical protein n=1 Tax=Candidatus Desulfosporosinus nitrosoreducens TaxID=3401928 RepID=UPI0027F88A70|nr:hypothetical protein [Desulfosporosinus sp. PR]MDQ7094878.1 hypothetical protein [Desulfosporosinus sp. PR]